MVAKEKIVEAINVYVADEILPSVGGLMKWGLAIGVGAYVGKMMNNGILAKLGYENDEGMVDEERLYHDLKEVATRNGNVVQEIPNVGKITFSASDVDSLYRRMK